MFQPDTDNTYNARLTAQRLTPATPQPAPVDTDYDQRLHLTRRGIVTVAAWAATERPAKR